MNRRKQREQLFYFCFESIFQPSLTAEEIFEYAKDEIEELDEYITESFIGIYEKQNEIDQLIIKNLKGWKFNRISKVSLAILRLSIYEILYNELVPDNVAINEAVEIAKKYGEEDASSFVNGILASVMKEKENK